jgi:hypothetical protein
MLGNIIVAAVVLAIIALAAWKAIKDRKKNGGGCGCSCDHCGSSDICGKS